MAGIVPSHRISTLCYFVWVQCSVATTSNQETNAHSVITGYAVLSSKHHAMNILPVVLVTAQRQSTAVMM